MANLRQRTTRLPFVVFLPQRDNYRHDLRVEVSPEPRVQEDQMGSYSVRPFMHRGGPALSSPDEKLPERWIVADQAALEQFRDGAIEYTEAALKRVVPVDRPE